MVRWGWRRKAAHDRRGDARSLFVIRHVLEEGSAGEDVFHEKHAGVVVGLEQAGGTVPVEVPQGADFRGLGVGAPDFEDGRGSVAACREGDVIVGKR